VLTLRTAAELLARADDIDGLVPIAGSLGCAGTSMPLDDATRAQLGLEQVSRAHVVAGAGALRALLLELDDRAVVRDLLPRLAARLASRAPHALWILLAVQRPTSTVAVAAWPGDRATPRIAALVVDRRHLVDSDAETVRALAAAVSTRDVLTHARWIEVLGREALTVRFYRALERAIGVLAASSRLGSLESRRELALLHTSRLLFLSFLEAKGWLDGDRAFVAHHFERCQQHGGRFHERVLRPLFFGTLNTPMRHRAPRAKAFGAIPFLNGGLFAPTPLERRLTGAAFSDDAFGALLFDVFGQYRFTAREETASWSEAAVDPEMLGRAFESLMSPPERRRTGAFFTPFSLVERVAASGLGLVDIASAEALARITVIDPACGSGAFLVHILERLALCAASLGDARDLGAIRRDVLTRSIFGVDVNPTAVWLCQLRLWLSVVIESTESDPTAVVPLPNLDRNVRVGDALTGSIQPADGLSTPAARALRRQRERYASASGARKESLGRALDVAERKRALANLDADLARIRASRRDLLAARRVHDLFGETYEPSREERRAAQTLRTRAADIRRAKQRLLSGGALPFSFAVQFADVLQRGGFSLAVGNPPWVRLHHVAASDRATFRRDFFVARAAAWDAGAAPAGAGRGFAAQVDVAALFIERSVRLLAPDGALSLLVPSKLWRSLAGGGVRDLLGRTMRLHRIEDYSSAPALFDAAVYPSLIAGRRSDVSSPSTRPPIDVVVHRRRHPALEWRAADTALPFDETPGAPWILLPPPARRAFALLRDAGPPLAASRIGRPHLGVKCGCNDAFVVELVDTHDGFAEIVTSAGEPATIECAMLRPLLRGEDLRRWCVSSSYASLIWTHDDAGAPLPSLPPLAARLLSPWRRTLAARTDARHHSRWWSLFRTESARHDLPRVVWGDVGLEPRASVLDAGDPRVPLNTCYVARCRELADAHALSALLNGPIARAWLDALAEPARGGYRRYLGWTLSLLPLPADWTWARSILAPAAQRAVCGAPHTDRELFELAAAAYELSPGELAPLVASME
jgi:hypothetical protein